VRASPKASRRVLRKVSGIETATGAPSVAFVTGVDAEMFGQLFLLLVLEPRSRGAKGII
jgi:hypothetical protein